MVIRWNLLEGYQGLTDLAEGGNEVWKKARNREIAGGLGKERGLSRVVGLDGQHATAVTVPECHQPFLPAQSHSLEGPGAGGNLWSPSPGLYAQPWGQREQREGERAGGCPSQDCPQGQGLGLHGETEVLSEGRPAVGDIGTAPHPQTLAEGVTP